jgi:hypothetical protein
LLWTANSRCREVDFRAGFAGDCIDCISLRVATASGLNVLRKFISNSTSISVLVSLSVRLGLSRSVDVVLASLAVGPLDGDSDPSRVF